MRFSRPAVAGFPTISVTPMRPIAPGTSSQNAGRKVTCDGVLVGGSCGRVHSCHSIVLSAARRTHSHVDARGARWPTTHSLWVSVAGCEGCPWVTSLARLATEGRTSACTRRLTAVAPRSRRLGRQPPEHARRARDPHRHRPARPHDLLHELAVRREVLSDGGINGLGVNGMTCASIITWA